MRRSYGMSWGIGGWLLTPFLQKVGRARDAELRQKVADEINTTFASHYTAELSLAEALQVETIIDYEKKETGKKYLVKPND